MVVRRDSNWRRHDLHQSLRLRKLRKVDLLRYFCDVVSLAAVVCIAWEGLYALAGCLGIGYVCMRLPYRVGRLRRERPPVPPE